MFLYIGKFPNGKRYVGITNNIKRRFASHKSNAKCKQHANIFLYNAVNKYGWDNIKWDVADGYESWEDLCKLEKETIADYNTRDRQCGYNITEGGNGCCGEKHPQFGTHRSAETKRKIKESQGNSPENRYNTHFTFDDVAHIRENYKNGQTIQEIANSIGTAWATISDIVKCRTWKTNEVTREDIDLCRQKNKNGFKPRDQKLSDTQVREIRRKFQEDKQTTSSLAKEYNVSQGYIRILVNRKCRII